MKKRFANIPFSPVTWTLSALGEFRQHKLRSFLSILGVTIAIASCAAMMALGEGFQIQQKRILAVVGALDLVRIRKTKPVDPKQAFLFARSRGLRFSDGDSLAALLPEVDGVSKLNTHWKGMVLRLGSENYKCGIIGTNDVFLKLSKTYHGRLFLAGEYLRGAPVCLVSQRLWKNMQKNHGLKPETFLGRTISIGQNHRLKVVGIVGREYTQGWHIFRSGIFVPMKYFEKTISGVDPPRDELFLSLKKGSDKTIVQQKIEKELLRLHRGVRDFGFAKMGGAQDFAKMMDNVYLVFSLITALALIVGGFNIMNVMLVSLSTRINEIGLRKAVGAGPLDIFAQFLFEALVLTLIGGVLGFFVGILPMMAFGDAFASGLNGLKPVLNAKVLIVTGAICVLEGLVAGIYPAFKALRMDPVTSLQYQ